MDNDDTQNNTTTFKMSLVAFLVEFIAVIAIGALLVYLAGPNAAIVALLIVIGLALMIGLATRYIFTSITIGKNYIEFRKGWILTSKQQIPYDNINTVGMNVDVIGKILNYGNLKISTGNDTEGIWFRTMDRPEELKNLIESCIEKGNNEGESGQANVKASDADELKKFAELRDKGAITQEEFEQKKKYLLDDDPNT
jgi:uncharacterized membrane protein YdbT with pleckstrin-like domain